MKCEARASDLTLTNHSDISPSRTSVMRTGERKHAKKSFKNNKKNQATQRLVKLSVKQ
jgi:hypothetical protein